MGIKDETPDDKVIFDSLDNRMKYSTGIHVEKIDPCACNTCMYKEDNPYKDPCGICLSPLNDKNFYVREGSEKEVESEPKETIPTIEDDIPVHDPDIWEIMSKVRQIYNMVKFIVRDDTYSCRGCRYSDEFPDNTHCDGCMRNNTGSDNYEISAEEYLNAPTDDFLKNISEELKNGKKED